MFIIYGNSSQKGIYESSSNCSASATHMRLAGKGSDKHKDKGLVVSVVMSASGSGGWSGGG